MTNVPVHMICCLALLGCSFSQAQVSSINPPISSTASPPALDQHHLLLNVYFKDIDRDGDIILLYGGVPLKTRLDGLILRTDAPGIIKIFLPVGVLLRAELVKKGTIPTVVLWKGTTNLNQQLIFHGGATETSR